MTTPKGELPAQPPVGYAERWWIPRVWTGTPAGIWLRRLHAYHWRICAARIPMAALQTVVGVYNSSMAAVQRAWFGRRIAAARIAPAPVFVIGHWRSGTTLMHELLALDPRHRAPSSFECFGAAHFLVTERFMVPWMQYLVPDRRPTDNMAHGLHHPQEDEFALCCLGQPSPYLALLFPNEDGVADDYYDLAALTPEACAEWVATLGRFLRSLLVRRAGRLVLKGPLHTARMRTLARVFPGARFVHMVRDPLEMIPSTIKLLQRLTRDQALQRPGRFDAEEFAFGAFRRLYHAHDADLVLLRSDQHCTVRYEDLVRDPHAELARIYETLGLGEIHTVLPLVERYWQTASKHVRVTAPADDRLRQRIRQDCSGYAARYGYELR